MTTAAQPGLAAPRRQPRERTTVADVRAGAAWHKADSEQLLDSLRGIDLSHVKRVAFKGGEPMVNPDLVAVLKHLDAIRRLEPVTTCLQDRTRAHLVQRYRALDPRRYAQVIRMLQAPHAGDRIHDQWVLETLRNDRLLGRDFRDALPDLVAEFELLDPEAMFADLERSRSQGVISRADFDKDVEALSRLPQRCMGRV